MTMPTITIDQPLWLDGFVDWDRTYDSDQAKVGLAIALAKENRQRGTGLPFGAAVFDLNTSKAVGWGVNLVARCTNSILHAETMALMSAQAGLGRYQLFGGDGGGDYILAASSEPCAMCLSAAYYVGIRQTVYGTLGHEIKPYGFGLGPGLADLKDFLDANGFEYRGGIRSDEVLQLFETMPREHDK
jgi:tRNA(Arg) A34 adenosine deaminase TadA